MNQRRFSVKARCVFPGDRPPLRNAAIEMLGSRITAVTTVPPSDAIDLGDVAILPGLVNPHTHLEFSSLGSPLGDPGIAMAEWIRQVVRWRRERQAETSPELDWRVAPIRAGISESARRGVTTIGEIATLPWPPEPPAHQTARGVVFLELLGLADDRQDALLQAACDFVDSVSTANWPFRVGLSPHAPYTVSPRLLGRLTGLSAGSRIPVAMHLAESLEELELLQSGSGPLVQLLDDLGAWQPTAIPRGSRPLDYLHQLAAAHRAIIIHGNYLARDEIHFLAQHNDRLSVVFCPTTHDYFEHRRYPLAEMHAAGVKVTIGTDSRASNYDLSLLRELRRVARQYAEVAPEQVLRMGTLAAAEALGIDDQIGSLTPGKRADFVVLPIPGDDPTDPYASVFESDVEVTSVYRAGELLFTADSS